MAGSTSLTRFAWLSIVAAVATISLKAAAYFLTGSVGLLSDALESLINLLAALIAFLSLWYAARPVDATHTYGHEKIEFFSSGLEGGLIFVAALVIAWSAVERLLRGPAVQSLDLGLALSAAAALINLGVALLLLRVGRRHRSIVLEADGQHLMTDVWTSAGVVVGLGLARVTGWACLDPFLALLVAGNICWTAFSLIRRSFNGLMDHALPPEEQALVRRAIEAHLEPGTAFHALRTRQAGADRFVDFHLLVPGRCSVTQAHRLAMRIEQAVQAALPGAEVVVHIEPIEEPGSWEDSELLAIERGPAQRRNDE